MASGKHAHSTLFLIAALWNWSAGVIFIGFPGFALKLAGLPMSVTGDMFYQLFWVIVFLFGFGYYMVSRNHENNRGIAWLGAIGKLGVFGLFCLHAYKGNVSYIVAVLGLGDAIFSVFFFKFLSSVKPQSA